MKIEARKTAMNAQKSHARRVLPKGGPVGLVLSAGGARGAYQIGCWKAFDERGLTFAAVSGSSIGALNGAFVCQGDPWSATDFWQELAGHGILKPDYRRLRRLAARLSLDLALLFAPVPNVRALRFLKYAVASMRLLSRHGTLGMLSAEGLIGLDVFSPLLERYLDVKKVLAQSTPLFVTAYRFPAKSCPRGKSLWFRVQDFGEEEAKKMLQASMSLPGIFPSVAINDGFYRDGGIALWAPIRPLYEAGFRRIVILATRAGFSFDPKDYPDCSVLVVKPKRSLGRFPYGTFRFTEPAVKEWIKQGYEDASKLLDKPVWTGWE